MDDFLEFDDEKKSLKSINLDDFSVEDLKKYIKELDDEKIRTELEIKKKIICKKRLRNILNNYLLSFKPLNLFSKRATWPSASLMLAFPPVHAG